MKFIVSRYNQDVNWLKEYTNNFIIYDRSDTTCDDGIPVDNMGTDIFDKFRFIVENYDNLPEVAVYTKANLFKYISKEEFDKVKDNKTFTPLLTQGHNTYMPVCYYKDGLYYEVNNYFYLEPHPVKSRASFIELTDILRMRDREYVSFCPGSNYILTKEDIRRHPKEFYIKLMSFLDWAVYPGEAQIIERNLYYIWGTDSIYGI